MELISQAEYQRKLAEQSAHSPTILLRNCRLPLSDGHSSPAHIVVRGKCISEVTFAEPQGTVDQSYDLKGSYVIPGMVPRLLI